MRINNNVSALRANTNLSRVEKKLDKSTRRLSSGYKINSASDDAAGFSISRKMRTQIKSLERASQNAADGISVIQTAEGALNEVSAMLNQLLAEIDRVSADTDFNEKKLLNGEAGRRAVTQNDGVSV